MFVSMEAIKMSFICIVAALLLGGREEEKRGLMMPKKSPVSYTILACSQQHLHNNTKGPKREHRCDAGQIPFEGQVRMFSQL